MARFHLGCPTYLNLKRMTCLFLPLIVLASFSISPVSAAQRPAKDHPNIVIVFTDDQGYQDVGVFGSPNIKTPNLDQMAKEGVRFTDFYAAQAVCSASRAALLTGCYPNRIGIQGALGPQSKIGINAEETTIAEVVKQQGYATAIYGKWHLGHLPEFLPTRHGFDDYFGLPYSNDMWPFHPTAGKRFPDLPLIENETIINPKVTGKEQAQLTTWYTERAVAFINQNHDKPFLLYVPHSMPHVPLFVSDKFKGKSDQGLYGDVIMEIDWSVGQIRQALKENGIEENTLVIFTSDNGPWLSYGNHAGSALPLREGKGTAWDGGQREPCIMAWPGQIPAGSVCNEMAMTIDILPTVAYLTGEKVPQDRIIDGKNIWPLMSGKPEAKSPHDALLFYWGGHLNAVRSGQWKLHFPHAYRSLKDKPGADGTPSRYVQKKTGLALYDLSNDISESKNVADQNPKVVKRLTVLAEKARADIGDTGTKRKGKNNRKPGRVD
ncbi:sulfatase [uncultured Gimesia sp.]|uniref:sulfatase family protein n=1 Tax=uncultured Gimesia sp. TaxID=1678688 RepID=UPI00261A82EC|nr:sulfatase [uncultured Gimesia sp.]